MNSFEQGFIDKCAEYNVIPEQLVKQAGLGNVLKRYWSLVSGSGARSLARDAGAMESAARGVLGSLEGDAVKNPALKRYLEGLLLKPAQMSNPEVKRVKDIPLELLHSLVPGAKKGIDDLAEKILKQPPTQVPLPAQKLTLMERVRNLFGAGIEHQSPGFREVQPQLNPVIDRLRNELPVGDIEGAVSLNEAYGKERSKSLATQLATALGLTGAGAVGYNAYQDMQNEG